MAINVTWRNVFMLVGLATTVVAALTVGTSGMVQWRFSALQYQLAERMRLFESEIRHIDERLDRLEQHK